MSRTITIDIFNPASIDAAVKEIRDYADWVKRKTAELARRLADMGAVNVSLGYSRAVYTGGNDISVTVEQQGENSYAIIANGEAVLFVEFGAGVTYGYGHPQPSVEGTPMGPGTYPSEKGHWNDPKGWWIPGGEHTYGNPPSMTMYLTAKELRNQLEDIAREVFSS
jgi:hypothetical protein